MGPLNRFSVKNESVNNELRERGNPRGKGHCGGHGNLLETEDGVSWRGGVRPSRPKKDGECVTRRRKSGEGENAKAKKSIEKKEGGRFGDKKAQVTSMSGRFCRS